MAKLTHALYTILLIEFLIGGGGSLFQIQGFSLRNIIHFICIIFLLPVLFSKRLNLKNSPILNIIIIWSILNLFSFYLGFFNKDFNFKQAFIDVKGQLVILLLPFLFYATNNRFWKLNNFVKIIYISGIINALMQISLTTILFFGIIDIRTIYVFFLENNEVVFRNFPFLQFKNHLISLLSLPFIIITKPRYYKFYILVIIISIITTLSRASIFFLTAIVFASYFFQKASMNGLFKRILIIMIIGIIIIISGEYLYEIYQSQRDLSQSNNSRLSDIRYILNNTSAVSFLTGNGTGTLINGRVNIENSYLWIFFKYGMIGLITWGLFLYYTYRTTIFKLRMINADHLIKAYIFSFTVLISYSIFNPYINNTIGLLFLFIFLTIQEKNYEHNGI